MRISEEKGNPMGKIGMALFLAMMLIMPFSGMVGSADDLTFIDPDYNYPTITNKNESCIINKTIWNMFEQIGGFNNTPNNTTGHSFLSAQLKDSRNNTHVVSVKVAVLGNFNSYTPQLAAVGSFILSRMKFGDAQRKTHY